MYPKNAASPERVDIGPVVQISDGAVQTSGVSVTVVPHGGVEASGGGTIAYTAAGVVLYTPTQAETNYTSFVLVASKSGCIPVSKTIVTTAESTAGTVKTGSIAANAVNASALATDAVSEIQSGLASQTSVDTLASYVDTEVAAIKAKTDNLPADPADASDIAASFSTVNSTLATIAAYIDTEIAAIKAKTDNLPADPADASDIAASFSSIASSIATLTAYVDTEVAAIKAKTDNLPTDPADQSAVEAAITAAASLLVTAAELAKVPKVGQTHRFTQVANNSGAKTADVSISVIP